MKDDMFTSTHTLEYDKIYPDWNDNINNSNDFV